MSDTPLSKELAHIQNVSQQLEKVGMTFDELVKVFEQDDVGGLINRAQVPGLLKQGDDYTVFSEPWPEGAINRRIGLMRLPYVNAKSWRPGGNRRCATLNETYALLERLKRSTGHCMAGYDRLLVLGTIVEDSTNHGYYHAVQVQYNKDECKWNYELVSCNTIYHLVLVPVVTSHLKDEEYFDLNHSERFARYADATSYKCSCREHDGCRILEISSRHAIIFHSEPGVWPTEEIVDLPAHA